MNYTPELDAALDYISDRAGVYGISLEDALSKLPADIIGDPAAMIEFVQNKHISHVVPQSVDPSLQGEISNWFFEDPAENMARGAEFTTPLEVEIAELDNVLDVIDGDYADASFEIADVLSEAAVEAATTGVDIGADITDTSADILAEVLSTIT